MWLIFSINGLLFSKNKAKALFYLIVRTFVFAVFGVLVAKQFPFAELVVNGLLLFSTIVWWLNEKVEKRTFSPLDTFTINGRLLGIFHIFPR